MPGTSIKAIEYLRPFMAVLPEVEQAQRQIPINKKLIWTGFTLLIFLICSQIPIYGVYTQTGSDPFYWMRNILASNRGTLMELGIHPFVTAGMVMQLLAGAKILDVDQSNKEEAALFSGATKLLAVIIAMCQSFAYVWSGMYGSLEQIGAGNGILIIVQLTFAGIVIIMLDELLQNGYGIGSGISLFIATNICETFLWKCFSPITMRSSSAYEYEGAIINLFHSLIKQPNKIYALQNAFQRDGLPNITHILATVFIFLVVIYFQGFHVNINVQNAKVRGNQPAGYQVKLFYTSNIPIILQSALISNLFFISQLLSKKFRGNFFINLLGNWQELEYGGHSVPVGGLAYYVSPPSKFSDTLTDPFHTIFYISFVLLTCALFSKTWIEVSGSSPKDVKEQLIRQNMHLKGFRDSGLQKQLQRYIPVAATFGGLCIGALTVLADFLGAIGSGTGILLAVNIVYQIVETLQKEQEKGESISPWA